MEQTLHLLPNDRDLHFPDFTIVSASAGSGKTHTLTLRMLQLLLSPRVPKNSLSNIVAMTFTNNAAAEIKERILTYLKCLYFGDEKILQEVSPLVSLDETAIRQRALEALQTIFDQYNDFHIETIDSFLTSVFRSAAVELGFAPTYTFTLTIDDLLHDALEEYLDFATTSPEEHKFLNSLLEQIEQFHFSNSKYNWDPFDTFQKKVTDLFSKLGHYALEPLVPEISFEPVLQRTKELWNNIERIVEASELETNQQFPKHSKLIHSNDFDSFFTKKFDNIFNKQKNKKLQQHADEVISQCEPFLAELKECARVYAELRSLQTYRPYIILYQKLKPYIETQKRESGKISLSEVTKHLGDFLRNNTLPEIYFYLGEEIAHFLIDEFQDTSPLQWLNLRPLCENALSQGGTLFIVGDTKQSIFSFRGADWRIMKQLMERNEFPSAPRTVLSLAVNRRSTEAIVSYTQTVFHVRIPAALDSEIADAATASGLATDTQEVYSEHRGKGRVIVRQAPADEEQWERKELLTAINDYTQHGFLLKHLAIITVKNDDVLKVSSWLNQEGIPFVSYSSLDIRNRKIIQEILAFLQFLDSPIDTLAFATVLLGTIFQKNLVNQSSSVTMDELRTFLMNFKHLQGEQGACYRQFQIAYPSLWEEYFAEPFRYVGYLSLYDLVCVTYQKFHLFELFPEEEASLTQFLEVVSSWESEGKNNLKDFLQYTESSNDDAPWTVEAPEANAVSIMTIHKAKGLGFPVVILLLYDQRMPSDNLYIEETEDNLQLWWVTNVWANLSEKIREFQHEQNLLDTVDAFNKLYVALTRAQKEMFIINVLNERSPSISSYLDPQGIELSGEQPPPSNEENDSHASILHINDFKIIESNVREQLRWQERQRGDAIHAALSKITFLTDTPHSHVSEAIEGIKSTLPLTINDIELYNTLVQFLSVPEIHQLFEFQEERIVLCEEEFVTNSGKLLRMDRVHIDPEQVTVIDFKTGHEEAEHETQIRQYIETLKELYPHRNIAGVLAYIDEQRVRWFQ